MISLRPMTELDFVQFRRQDLEYYAQELARTLGTPLEQERAAAARQWTELLTAGLRTPGHYFWMITENGSADIGQLWGHHDETLRRAFIYVLSVVEGRRRQGVGTRALKLLEEFLRLLGVTHIGLNVFADNTGAIALYEVLGYRPTSHTMHKAL